MKCWQKAMSENDIDWQDVDDSTWCGCFVTCANPEPEIEVELEVKPEPEVEVKVAKVDCDCDGCYWGGDCDMPDDDSDDDDNEADDDDDSYDDYDYTPRCEGFTVYECGKELESWEEKVCDSCVEARKRQEQIEDEAVEAYERRQRDMEERQGMEYHGDFDGDFEDGDREEEDQGQGPVGHLAMQMAEDKKKRNF